MVFQCKQTYPRIYRNFHYPMTTNLLHISPPCFSPPSSDLYPHQLLATLLPVLLSSPLKYGTRSQRGLLAVGWFAASSCDSSLLHSECEALYSVSHQSESLNQTILNSNYRKLFKQFESLGNLLVFSKNFTNDLEKSLNLRRKQDTKKNFLGEASRSRKDIPT